MGLALKKAGSLLSFFGRFFSGKRKRLKLAGAVAAVFTLPFFVLPVSDARLSGAPSLRILSSEGTVLRQFRTPGEGSYCEWVRLEEYPPYLVRAVITAEDRRFRYHPGVDPASAARALAQNLRARRIVSGASTITQQLVRIAWREGIPENRFLRKIAEMILAVRVELWHSKDRILECYLNRVPLAGNRSGFPSAARRIFGRDLRFLSLEEQTALVALIRGSGRGAESLETRFIRLWRSAGNGEYRGLDRLSSEVFGGARQAESSGSVTRHFEEWIHRDYPDLKGDITTCISQNMNDVVQEIVNSELLFLERYDTDNAAVVVISLEGDGALPLAAMVGSRDFDDAREGQVNGCLAVRQAGSTLKPFVYALAIDTRGVLPNTIVSDREEGFSNMSGEVFIPKNYDLACWGPLTVREALGASRNIPAVAMLDRVGVPVFYSLLKNAGFDHMSEGPGYYGHGLALGAGGADLVHLTRLYASIARGGELLPVLVGAGDSEPIMLGSRTRLFSRRAALYITDILCDRDIRRRSNGGRNFLDFPFDVAVKTGTSKDYRDAWTVGFTDRYAVGVWTGNFSGKTMKRVSGSWGSGRIFHQVMRYLAGRDRPGPVSRRGLKQVRLCRNTGLLALPSCPFYEERLFPSDFPHRCCTADHGHAGKISADTVPRVISPSRGERFVIDPLSSASRQPVPLKISYNGTSNSRGRFRYSVDSGAPVAITSTVNRGLLLQRGDHCLTVYDGNTKIDSVGFRIE